jgi:hypothetical protein
MTYNKTPKIQIYGITGKKGSGKDSFAKLVQEHKPKFIILRFADDLKWMTHKIFGFPMEFMESQEEKARKLDTPIQMDSYLPLMVQYTGLPLQNHNLVSNSLREILQQFGTDYVRSVCDNYWVDRVVTRINRGNKRIKNKVLIPDCRFQNEVDAIRKLGGKVIKIVRIDLPKNTDFHVSEQNIDLIKADLTLGTLSGKFNLQKQVAFYIAINKDQCMGKFDYPKVKSALDCYTKGGTLVECNIKLGINNENSKTFYSLMEYYGIKPRVLMFKSHRFENGVEVKKCGKCKSFLPLNDFGRSFRAWDLLLDYCVNCKADYSALNKVNTLYKIWKSTKRSSKQRGIEFDLSLEDVEKQYEQQNKKCFYSGVEMTEESGFPNKVTIDRINSDLGYIKSNIVLCGYIANMMKNKMSIEHFANWVKLLYDNYGNWAELK